jgi:Fe-S cluster biogenesis protein NfuA
MIIRSYLVTLWAVLFVSCGPTVAQSVAVFDFELIDTSLEGAIRGARPDEQQRLARLSDQLRQLLRDSGRFSLVDITPIASEALASNLQACGGCDIQLARRIGAEMAITGTVQKVSKSDPQHEHLRSRRFVRSNHCGHERRHARQYRRVVVTHTQLAGSQSASRAWLWPPALSNSIT